MNMVLYSSIFVLGMFCIERFGLGVKRSIEFYTFAMILAMAAQFVTCHASIIDQDYQKIIPEKELPIPFIPEGKINADQRKYYTALMLAHRLYGFEHAQDAEQTSLLIPNKSDREWAREILQNLVASLPWTNPQSKLVAICMATLASYLAGVCDQWVAIQNCLNQSEYHYKMAEHYKAVLDKG